VDQTLFHLINERWTNPVLDLLMAAISNVEIWKPLFILIALGLAIFGGFKGRIFILCLLISLLVAEQFTNLLKSTVHRPRPWEVQSVRLVEMQEAQPAFLTLFKKTSVIHSQRNDPKRAGYSFPSGHVTNTTLTAICCAVFFRRQVWLYSFVGAVALAVGYSRIYLGAHWPSDVLGTLFLAAAETLLVLGALEWLWRKVVAKWMPKAYAQRPSLIFEARRGTSS
jgi:undecaprenyl-diphosphatase